MDSHKTVYLLEAPGQAVQRGKMEKELEKSSLVHLSRDTFSLWPRWLASSLSGPRAAAAVRTRPERLPDQEHFL